MIDLIPFCGYRYSSNKISDLSTVTTPPYDIISSKEQEQYYSASDYNIIRLEYGKSLPNDDNKNNKYTRAAQTLDQWISTGVLVQEKQPAFYIYRQQFHLSNGKEYTRTGFIGLVRLEEFSKGNILPHENTLSKPKADRLDLMRACNANFSQIFALYDDPTKNIPNTLNKYTNCNSPSVQIESVDGIIDQLWVVSDGEIIKSIQNNISNKQLFIADGHHRYETALNYRNEFIRNNPHHTGNELYNYIMVMMVEMEDPGLIILPTHRCIDNISDFSAKTFLDRASQYFLVENVEFHSLHFSDRAKEIEHVLNEKGAHSYVFYDGNTRNYTVLSLKNIDVMDKFYPYRNSAYKELDVSVLHILILENILGIGERQLANQENITYTHSIHEGIEWVEQSKLQMAFFIPPTTIKQIKNISLAGEKMPQKSTYFYPKLLTGLVINKF